MIESLIIERDMKEIKEKLLPLFKWLDSFDAETFLAMTGVVVLLCLFSGFDYLMTMCAGLVLGLGLRRHLS